MRLAVYQPEIPGNLGALLRLSACFDVGVDIIEPCGFPFSDKALRRSAMDYIDAVDYERHADWVSFRKNRPGRLVLMTTKGAESLFDVTFAPDDILLMGSESAGVPEDVHASADLRIRIPIRADCRSLNISVAAGIALSEALRQTRGFPHVDT
jgi:tRNA (cytidine/uridine-2'-O-)-methyltransferase